MERCRIVGRSTGGAGVPQPTVKCGTDPCDCDRFKRAHVVLVRLARDDCVHAREPATRFLEIEEFARIVRVPQPDIPSKGTGRHPQARVVCCPAVRKLAMAGREAGRRTSQSGHYARNYARLGQTSATCGYRWLARSRRCGSKSAFFACFSSYQSVCKTSIPGSNPGGASKIFRKTASLVPLWRNLRGVSVPKHRPRSTSSRR